MRFSVVTPSLGQLPWLELCAASVADQGVEVEHLVQDAGTPGIEVWGERHPGVKLQVGPDSGMYDAMGKGFDRAGGGVLSWLNCDEQYLPGTLAQVGDFFAQRPEVEVVFGDVLLVDGGGGLLSYRRVVLPKLRHVQACHLNTYSCATFFRRSVVDRGLRPETRWKTISDAVWIAEMLRAGVPMARLGEPLAAFTFTEENLGQGAVASAERADWRRETGMDAPWRRRALAAEHRLAKFLQGAYRKRVVTTELFTRQSPAVRTRVHADRLGSGWPNSTQKGGS